MKNQTKIYFETATSEHLELLELWDKQAHVIASDPNDDWNWETELKRFPTWREQFVAYKDEEAIGFVQIIDPQIEESHYWGEVGSGYRAIDIWIGMKKNLNKGYGTEMMNLAIDHCFANPEVHSILIDPLASNKKAHRFYERLGFEFLEMRTFDSDECYIYVLKKDNWQKITNLN